MLRKSKFSYKSGKNNGYSTRRSIHIYDNVSVNSSKNEKRFTQKLQRKFKDIIYSIIASFFENRVVSKIIWKNIVQPRRPYMTIRRMRFA